MARSHRELSGRRRGIRVDLRRSDVRSSNGRGRGRYGRSTGTRTQLAIPAGAAMLILLTATACSSGGKPTSTAGTHKPAAPAAAAAHLSISPDNGTRNAAPNKGITVRVENGKI